MFNNLCSFHKRKKIHIVDLYAVPTWKDKNVDPVHCLPVSVFFFFFFYHLLINRERYLLGIGTKVYVYLCMHIILSQYY